MTACPPARSAARVLRLVPRRPAERSVSADTVDALEQLLARARQGDVVGLALAYLMPDSRYAVDTTGECARDPTFARGMVCALDDELSRLIHQAADD